MSSFINDFRNKNIAAAIGIIGRTCGTTTMVITEKEEQEKFLSYAAGQIAPCERTFKELEEYLIEKYQAIPYTPLSHELKMLKTNVIMNYFENVLDRPDPLGENPTEEELIAYAEEDTSFFQAMEYPAERLGLEMKAYKLPPIPSSEKDGIIQMEMKTEYMFILNGSREVIDDLTFYRGVSEKDIKEKSPRFIGFAYLLKSMGKLTNNLEV